MGMKSIKPCISAIVKDLKGPLEEGMEEKFRQIGVKLATQ